MFGTSHALLFVEIIITDKTCRDTVLRELESEAAGYDNINKHLVCMRVF